MSFIAVQSYLITEIVGTFRRNCTPSKLFTPSVKIVHTPPSSGYLEDYFEIFCGIVFTRVKSVAAGIV